MGIRLLIFFIALFQLSSLLAQKGIFKGKISDAKTKEMLGGVSIYIDSKGVTTSNADGIYETKFPAGSHSVEFRFIGYSAVVHKVDIRAPLKTQSQSFLKNSMI